MEVDSYETSRKTMVTLQIQSRGLNDPRLLAAFRTVPRHRFVPQDVRENAYDDYPLPIGEGQTISQPYIVARMTDLLQLKGDENILEIGTGSGYQAAILAQLARSVHTIERHEILARRASHILAGLGYNNVTVHTGDGSCGWEESAPYDGILVTAAAPAPPPPLLQQLASGGRLVIPVGSRGGQILEVWRRAAKDYQKEDIIGVVFVPLRGQYGWGEDDWENTPIYL